MGISSWNATPRMIFLASSCILARLWPQRRGGGGRPCRSRASGHRCRGEHRRHRSPRRGCCPWRSRSVLCVEGHPRFMPFLESNTSQIPGVTIAAAVLSDVNGTDKGKVQRARRDSSPSRGRRRGRVCPDTDAGRPLLSSGVLPSSPHQDRYGRIRHAYPARRKRVLTSARPVVFYEWDPYPTPSLARTISATQSLDAAGIRAVLDLR